MKWFVRIITFCCLAAAFIFSAAVFRRPPDPVVEGRLVSVWLNQLLSPDYSARNEAHTALLVLGEPAVPQIRTFVRRRNAPWHPYAATVCKRLPFLHFQVYDAAASRQAAADLLADMGPKARSAAGDLVDALEFDPGRESVSRALRKLGSAAEPELRAGLRARHENIRSASASLLGELPTVSSETAADLLRALVDSSEQVRAQSALTLGLLNSAGAEHKLSKLLREDPSPLVRARSAEAVGKLSPVSESALVTLKERMLHDSQELVRFQCASAIWTHTKQADLVLPSLIALLDTPEGWRATYLLGQIGPGAAPAIPALIKVLHREQVPRPFRTPPSSAFALGQIGPAALPELFRVLLDARPRTRLSAVVAISFMGARGHSATPRMLPLLQDKNIEVRHGTAMALGMIGAKGEAVIAGLADCLEDEDIYLRSAAADILRKIAPEREWVVLAE